MIGTNWARFTSLTKFEATFIILMETEIDLYKQKSARTDIPKTVVKI